MDPHYHADHIGDIAKDVAAAKQRGVNLRIIASLKTKQSMDLAKSSFPQPTAAQARTDHPFPGFDQSSPAAILEIRWERAFSFFTRTISGRSMTSPGITCRGAMATSALAPTSISS